MNLQNLLTNWKTTSAGIALIGHGVIHLGFCLKSGTADEGTWNLSIGEVLAGVGLIVAGDASQSATKADVSGLASAAADAIKSGDTSILTKPDAGQPPSNQPK